MKPGHQRQIFSRILRGLLLATFLVAGCGTRRPTATPSSTATARATATLSPPPTITAAATRSTSEAAALRTNTLPPPTATETSTTPATATSLPATTATVPNTPTADADTATATGPAPPPTSPTPRPSPQPAPYVAVWEGSLTLNSYGWEQALVETGSDDPLYPYPRLDPGRVGPPAPRTYKTLVLDNDYTQLTLLPELGGRLYRWLDKASGQELFYVNPVLKPTHWGARGWWLATGGMEWAFPVEEHGLIEWRPWDYEIARGGNWVSVTLSDREEQTGLGIEITVQLTAGRSDFVLRPLIHNPTTAAQSYQFWLNGMFALSPSNRPSPELRFVLPSPVVTVHSTGDGALPGPGSEISWPLYNGRDLGRYGNWTGWLGVFARPAASANYMGLYDPASQLGVARVFPAAVARGAKIFGPAGIDPATWTDDGSGYVELWGGVTPTFWDYATLSPGGSVGWKERWYSLSGLGGLSYANAQAALWLAPSPGELQVGALTPTPTRGQLQLWHAGQVVESWPVTLGPDAPFRARYPVDSSDGWGLQLLGADGQPIAAYGAVGP